MVEGLIPIKRTLDLLRTIRARFKIRDDVAIQFTEAGLTDNGTVDKTVLEARWTVKLGLQFPAFESAYASSPLLACVNKPCETIIEAASKVHFSEEGLIDYILIDEIRTTGDLAQSWPDVTASDDREVVVRKIRQWAMDFDEADGSAVGAASLSADPMIARETDLVSFKVSPEIQYLASSAGYAALLGGAADAISVSIDGLPIDLAHAVSMGISAGVLSGVCNAAWLQELEREVPGTDASAVLTKTVADYVIAGTAFNSGYLLFVPVLASAFVGMPLAPDHLLDGWSVDKFIDVMKLEICTFTPYNLFAFRLIPPEFRPVAAAAVSALNSIVLSGITRSGLSR